MKATKKLFIAVSAVAIAATVAYAAVLLTEPFAYPDGNLFGQGGWTDHSGLGNKPQQVIGGLAQYEQSPGSGEDLNTPFAVQDTAATTYACLELTIPRQGPLGLADVGTTEEYVVHFREPPFNFMARCWIGPPEAGGDYRFGLTSTSGTRSNIVDWAVDSFFDVTYKIAISYDAETGDAKLWVDPADQNDTSITQTGFSDDQVQEFALRQTDPTGLGAAYYVQVDNIKVAQLFHEACDTPVQVDQTTWGRVKGTYR
jgi:hypothetical protein